jgi:hypothetical protein
MKMPFAFTFGEHPGSVDEVLRLTGTDRNLTPTR